MDADTPEYNWSDAWILLAIVYAGDKGATLERIISVGDGINHAIFNPDELESGLARLASGGLIKEKNGIISPTVKVKRAYSKTTTPRRTMFKELEDMRVFLLAAPSSLKQPKRNNLKYPGFSITAYDEAVDSYVEKFGQKVR